MAAENRGTSAPVSEQLFRAPFRFDFFQAVRLLEALARAQTKTHQVPLRAPVGSHAPPDQEVVRFRVLPTLSFPPSPIHKLQAPAATAEGSGPPPEMTVTHLGLIGAQGTLPQHYTALILERCHVKFKDYSLRDFLDLFHHRSVSLFYRAWEKYRYPLGYERSHQASPNPADGTTAEPDLDLFTYCLFSLVGFGTDGLRGRMEVDDEALIYYAGHFSHSPKCQVSLESLLEDYFRLPAEVRPFQGQWLYLARDEQSALPSYNRPLGSNVQLGENVIVGERVWSVESKFRVRLGPLSYKEFCHFMPSGRSLRPLCQLVRLYMGLEFDFDVQAILYKEEVPWLRMQSGSAAAPRLGWNTWLRSRPYPRDAEEGVFSLSDV